ncbi:argininosuccinate lyase [Candidatus Bipolaricaulota bacterium]|nr:argininosuccinate lyase [Candidatus Bipolaricaulota bacterium]
MKTWKTGEEGEKTGIEKLVENFTAGADVGYDQCLAEYDIYGSIAHVHALEKLDLVTSPEAKKLRNGLRKLLEKDISLDAGDEDIHSKVENEITDALGELGKKLHTARSRNDQVLVDIRLFTKAELFRIVRELLSLVESLLYFGSSQSDTPMVGFTHYRKAMPSSVGLWAGSYAEALLDDLTLLEANLELIDQSPLGAGAGYGIPVNLDRELTAETLGFSRVQNNAIYVMNSRGKFEFNLLSAVASVQLDLSRLASDLISFSDKEFNFFEIPEKFTTGSSIMPQKKNPDVLELVRGRSASFPGHLSSLFSLLHGLRSGYSRDLQETKKSLIVGLGDTGDSLAVLAPLVSGLGVNEEELMDAFSGEVFATDRVFELVKDGLPFREAYRRVKNNLDSQVEEVSEDQIRGSISSRNHPGGPGNLGLGEKKNLLERSKEKWAERESRFVDCLRELRKPEGSSEKYEDQKPKAGNNE